jgi:outer membrane protein assembly factor BamB
MRIVATALLVLFSVSPLCRGEDWPCWRGPRGDGSSAETAPPTHWTGSDNVAWKTEIPGRGHSSPIVWRDRVFVTSCLEETAERVLLCLDRATGNVLWQQTVLTVPLERKHSLNSFASSTPATDGEQVYATFLDGEQMFVAAYDLAGQELWTARPGGFSSQHGYCTCPVLFEDLVILNGDHDGEAYLVALRRDDGQVVWKTRRENNTRSYVTPLIREIDGRTQLVLSGNRCVASYDPHDGSRHWIIDGPTEQFVASMVYDGHLLFLTAGYPEYHILAIRPDGAGNVTGTHIAWRTTKGAGYVPSPVLCGPYLLNVTDGGVATSFEASSGRRVWTERIGTHYSASLVTAAGLVYFLADDGVTKVVRAGEEFELVAENALGEPCYASPAISDGQIFLRGERHLYAIGR